MPSLLDLQARLLRRAERRGTCLIWTGGTTTAGYSQVGGTENGERYHYYGHRLVWEIHNGPIPDDHHVHHACGNPACIEPTHLEVLPAEIHLERHYQARRHDVCVRGHDLTAPDSRNRGGCRECGKLRSRRWRESHP